MKKNWITSQITSYQSYKIQLIPTSKIWMRKWRISQKTSHKWLHQWWIRLKCRNRHQTRKIHQRLRILPLWYRIKRKIHRWKVEIQKNDGMWTLKREIISPKFDELLIKTEIKGYIAIDLRKFYNHVNICINEVTRIREDLLPDYQSIKRHSDFEEYFVPYREHPSYSCNV